MLGSLAGGGLTNSGTMPITGGQAGPSTSGGTNKTDMSVGSLNVGSNKGVNPWLVGGVVLVLAYLMKRK